MAKLTLQDLTSSFGSQSVINANQDAIETAMENTLSRDGTSPNTMSADIDLNSNDLLNVNEVRATRLYLGGALVTSVGSTPSWEGDWATSTAYAVNAVVKYQGNLYICLTAHTSGTFNDDLAAVRWELYLSQEAQISWEGAWVTSTAYAVNNVVSQNNNTYICLVAHTSGTFATDLAANRWEVFTSGTSSYNTDITISTTKPYVYMVDTDATAAFGTLGLFRDNTSYGFETRSGASGGSVVQADYTVTVGASGATEHEWITAGGAKLELKDQSGENGLTISNSGDWAKLHIDKASSGQASRIIGSLGESDRWSVDFGDSTAESGSDAGSDFTIKRYDDTGTLTGDALKIRRDDNQMLLYGEVTMVNDGKIKFNTGPSIEVASASPEGVVSANAGSICLSANGSIYRKNSGTGSTGWVLI